MTAVSNNGNNAFRDKTPNACIKYPRKRISSKLVCKGNNKTAISTKITKGTKLKFQTKFSGCSTYSNPIILTAILNQSIKAKNTRFQSIFFLLVISVFGLRLCTHFTANNKNAKPIAKDKIIRKRNKLALIFFP